MGDLSRKLVARVQGAGGAANVVPSFSAIKSIHRMRRASGFRGRRNAMPLYRILMTETWTGYATLEAESEKEALDYALETLAEEGLEGFVDLETDERHVDVLNVEQVDGEVA